MYIIVGIYIENRNSICYNPTMAKNPLSVSSLYGNNIFQSVNYDENSELISDLQYDLLLERVNIALEELATIRDNPSYCQMVSDHIGYDLAEGFEQLQYNDLFLSSKNLNYGGFLQLGHVLPDETYQDHQYFHIINIGKDYIFPGNKILDKVISFSMAGALLGASTIIANKLDPKKFQEQRDYKQCWKEIYAADALMAAGNPKKNNAGHFILQHFIDEPLNALYQTGIFPRIVAEKLANFTVNRDELLIKFQNKTGVNIIDNVNGLFAMSCSQKFPPAISRSVEMEKFAAKAQNFLKNQNS